MIAHIVSRIALGAVAAVGLTVSAHAASIEGNWRTQAGANATIAKCGGSFCLNITSGEHAGKRIGRVTAQTASKYTGTVTDPGNGKQYSGSAIVSGNSLKLSGCVARVLCRSQTWSRR